jgi:hypothetical protein
LLGKKKKKRNIIFHIYKEIQRQSGAVQKSYMRKGFLIYEEMHNFFPIYEEAVCHIGLCNCSTLNFLIYKEIVFISACVLINRDIRFRLCLFVLLPRNVSEPWRSTVIVRKGLITCQIYRIIRKKVKR